MTVIISGRYLKGRSISIAPIPEHVSGAETGAERAENRLERSGAVSGVQKIKRSGSGRSSERERCGERAKFAAQNPLHRKTTQSKMFKIKFQSYHETVS